MHPTLIAVLVVAAYAAGVITHKYVISETERIKTAISTAVLASETRIRGDIASLVNKASAEASKVASKI